jgi:Pyruvate/2-oxoacid:ferredoxin oxidoreductase delta subunit
MPPKLHLYYFSGTGNAKNVAYRIVKKAGKYGINSCISDLSQIDRKNISAPAENEMIGFVSPTHGFNFPPVTMYFIFRFPRTKFKNKVFIVNTRAGMKLGKYFLPGLSGLALWLAVLALWIKGYKIIGLRSIDLPSNWISLHPGLKEKVVLSIQERCRRITDKFADDIFNGKKNYRALYDILQDLLVSPIGVLYFFIGRFFLAKTFYASSKCNNCDVCIEGCPVHAIKKISNRPYWTFKCESCMKCMNTCPQRAIETGHGYVFGSLYVINTFAIVAFWNYISTLNFFPEQGAAFQIMQQLVDAGLTLFLLMIGYRLIHYLKRMVILKQIIEYTSLTKYAFWRRYKYKENQKEKDMISSV